MLTQTKPLTILGTVILLHLSGCVSSDGQLPPTPCGSDCGGLLTNNPEKKCALYDSTKYTEGTAGCAYNEASGQCIVDTSACVGAGTTPGGLFAACVGSGQGSCQDGLLCESLTETGSNCFRSCIGSTDTTTCIDLDGTPGICLNRTDAEGGVCMKKTVDRDGFCLTEDFDYCQNSTDECMATSVDSNGNLVGYRCKAFCDGSDIGSQGDCASGETCLADPTGLVSVQADGSDYLSCTDDSTCSTTDGYSCLALSDGNYCAKPFAVCGATAPILGQFSEASTTSFLEDEANICNPWSDHIYCSIDGTSADADAEAGDALAYCYEIDMGEEGVLGGICIALCEGEDGEPDDNCGSGYSCQTPPAGEEFFFTTQKDSGGTNEIPCSEGDNSNCDEDNGYACHSLTSGFLCAKALKMCAATGS